MLLNIFGVMNVLLFAINTVLYLNTGEIPLLLAAIINACAVIVVAYRN